MAKEYVVMVKVHAESAEAAFEKVNAVGDSFIVAAHHPKHGWCNVVPSKGVTRTEAELSAQK